MRYPKILLLSSLAFGLMAQSASAYPYHHRDRYWDHDDRYWRRGGRDVVIVETPPPAYIYNAPPYYARPSTVYVEPSPEPVPYRSVRCSSDYNPAGTIIGGVAGGALGSAIGNGSGRTAAIITGAILGGAIGTGATTRQYCTEQVFDAPIGTPVHWQDENLNNVYTVTPTRDFREAGRYCREYQAVADVGGRPRETYGRACQQPDGSWEIIN